MGDTKGEIKPKKSTYLRFQNRKPVVTKQKHSKQFNQVFKSNALKLLKSTFSLGYHAEQNMKMGLKTKQKTQQRTRPKNSLQREPAGVKSDGTQHAK